MTINVFLHRKTYLIAALAFALIGAAPDAQQMYSQRDDLQILDAPDIAGVPLEIVEMNTLLLVQTDTERWMQVETPSGVVGWVLNSALGAEEASDAGGLTNVLALSSPTLDTAAAGRGVLSAGAEQYASNNNYDPAILDQMFEARIRARGQWRNFVRDGGLVSAVDFSEDEQ